MHPNPVFHTQGAEANLAYARDRAFGTLAVNGEDTPLLSHIPFLLDDDGQTIWLHLVRSNPIARALKTAHPCKLSISGPDSYVSPDWYGIDDQVPTWNYLAVHISGTLELLPQEMLRDILDRESAFFETRLQTKKPWVSTKMSPGVMDKMMRAIVPCKITVTDVDGTWKLNQNKPDAVRLSAADHIEVDGVGTELAQLANLMRASNGQA